MHDRFNNWLATVLFAVGLTAFALLGVHIIESMRARLGALEQARQAEDERLPAGAYTNPGPYPHETYPEASQRTWADLFAACRLTDAWLGSTLDGEPVCYPMGQAWSVTAP